MHGVDETGRLGLLLRHRAQPHRRRRLPRAARRHRARTPLRPRRARTTAIFNPSFTLYVDTWSDAQTPPAGAAAPRGRRACRASSTSNTVPALRDYRLSRWEFLQVKTRDGFPMEAMILKPPDFDPARQYPVYQHTYGGPHAPQVQGRLGRRRAACSTSSSPSSGVWSGSATTAPRAARARSPCGRPTSGSGPSELQDIEDGVAWLKTPALGGSGAASASTAGATAAS